MDFEQYTKYGIQYSAVTGDGSNSFKPISTQQSQFNYHPLTVSFSAHGTLTAYVIPEVTFKVEKLIPIVISPMPFVGVDIAAGAGSGCTNNAAIHYSLFFGVSLGLGMDVIKFTIMKLPLTVGWPFLPFTLTLPLLPKFTPSQG